LTYCIVLLVVEFLDLSFQFVLLLLLSAFSCHQALVCVRVVFCIAVHCPYDVTRTLGDDSRSWAGLPVRGMKLLILILIPFTLFLSFILFRYYLGFKPLTFRLSFFPRWNCDWLTLQTLRLHPLLSGSRLCRYVLSHCARILWVAEERLVLGRVRDNWCCFKCCLEIMWIVFFFFFFCHLPSFLPLFSFLF
jgi:hypothetical protein